MRIRTATLLRMCKAGIVLLMAMSGLQCTGQGTGRSPGERDGGVLKEGATDRTNLMEERLRNAVDSHWLSIESSPFCSPSASASVTAQFRGDDPDTPEVVRRYALFLKQGGTFGQMSRGGSTWLTEASWENPGANEVEIQVRGRESGEGEPPVASWLLRIEGVSDDELRKKLFVNNKDGAAEPVFRVMLTTPPSPVADLRTGQPPRKTEPREAAVSIQHLSGSPVCATVTGTGRLVGRSGAGAEGHIRPNIPAILGAGDDDYRTLEIEGVTVSAGDRLLVDLQLAPALEAANHFARGSERFWGEVVRLKVELLVE